MTIHLTTIDDIVYAGFEEIIMYNLYNFEAEFQKFLQSKSMSSSSVRNYLSDFRHFWTWFLLCLQQHSVILSEHDPHILSFLNTEVLQHYKDFLVANPFSVLTVNRRLTTIRQFVQYAFVAGMIAHPVINLPTNVSLPTSRQEKNKKIQSAQQALLTEFATFLDTKGVKSTTKRSYLADVQHFLHWTESKLTTSD